MRRAKKLIAASALGIALTIGAAAALIFSLSGRLPNVATDPLPFDGAPPFRTWAEHDEIYQAAAFPIVLAIDRPRASVRYVGALHTSDPEHPQLKEIRRVFKEFGPTVVLVEGRARLFDPPLHGLNGHNEVAFTYELARRAGVKCFTLEPPYEREVAGLLEHWPAEAVAVYFVTRVFTADGGSSSKHPESVLRPLLAKRTNVDGLRGVLDSVEDFERAWTATVGDEFDWRTLDSADEVPVLRRIGDDSREIRGRHMVRAISTLALHGERVMAVVGASHVIRQEPTLRWLLDERGALYPTEP